MWLLRDFMLQIEDRNFKKNITQHLPLKLSVKLIGLWW